MLSDYIRYRLKEKLQTIPGVGEIHGGRSGAQRPHLARRRKMDAREVTVGDVIGCPAAGTCGDPGRAPGDVGREVNIRVLGEALDLETLRHIVIRENSGSPVYISDVALVEDGFEDMRRIQRVNGVPAQGMGIKKQRGANAVAVARQVRKALVEFQKYLPADMEVGIRFDSTKFIEDSVNEIQLELLLSVLLTALVCWMFLGSFSSTLNVILAIPMSLLGTMAVIYFLGFTFNTFTLLGMALAVGIVVDDAIMVMENIFRHAESGKGLVQGRAGRDRRDRLRRPGGHAGRGGHFSSRGLCFRRHRPFFPAVRRHLVPGRPLFVRRGGHPGAGPLLAVPEDLPREAATASVSGWIEGFQLAGEHV